MQVVPAGSVFGGTKVSPAGSVFGGSGVTLCVTPGLACGLGHSAGLKAPRAFIQDRGAASLPRPTVRMLRFFVGEAFRLPHPLRLAPSAEECGRIGFEK